jgi:hypothetical protein
MAIVGKGHAGWISTDVNNPTERYSTCIAREDRYLTGRVGITCFVVTRGQGDEDPAAIFRGECLKGLGAR